MPAEIEALVLATLRKRVNEREKLVKALIGQRYPDGHRESFRTPDGSKLGMVLRTDPEPEWVITDRDALVEHLSSFPGAMVTEVRIAPEDMPEALAVLAEHAPNLVTETSRLDPAVVDAALAQSRATGQAAAPGIARIKPAGVLTVRPDKVAGEAVERMVAAGQITWDGRPVLETPDTERREAS